ncbi:MAG: hypothetical protein ACRDJC_26490 [Thermomicrobiales bacterium]
MAQLERCREPLLPKHAFLGRLLRFIAAAMGVVSAGLLIGMLGYHNIAHLSWVDSFLNASMILAGMGPVSQLEGDAAKVFAGFYALFAGFIFLAAAGLLFTPLLHRLLHHFHLEGD